MVKVIAIDETNFGCLEGQWFIGLEDYCSDMPMILVGLNEESNLSFITADCQSRWVVPIGTTVSPAIERDFELSIIRTIAHKESLIRKKINQDLDVVDMRIRNIKESFEKFKCMQKIKDA